MTPTNHPHPSHHSLRRTAILSAAVTLAAGPALDAPAEGFRAPTAGTAGLGATGGRIAFIDDASAVFHNPANLVELPAWEAAAEPTFVYHSVRYESPAGNTAETTDPWKILPHFFAGGPIADGRFAAGLGVSVPFGLSVDWGNGDALRFAGSRYVQLKAINFNPSVAARLGDNVRIGAGFDAMWSEITLSQYYPWALVAGVPRTSRRRPPRPGLRRRLQRQRRHGLAHR